MALSQTIEVKGSGADAIGVCATCRHEIGPLAANWKCAAAVTEKPLKTLGGPYANAAKVVLREFACPSCGALLDSETAAPEDPFLHDQVYE